MRGEAGYIGEDKVPRLNVLDLQHLIRYIPKPVIAAVADMRSAAVTCSISSAT